ncbi:MAG: hypothetical protein V5A38_09575 [Halolamina sp.]|uniref:hypothetical protein n=1 Tax=Halolamina sp. TaxID=1940283 RepID=UPI002FC3214A
MKAELVEPAVELGTILLYALLSSLLTVGGLLSELSAVGRFSTGEVGIGVWLLFMGVVGIYAGVVLVGRDIVWQRLTETVA